MKDQGLSDDWPGEPVSIAGVMKNADGALHATVNGNPVDPAELPDLLAALESATDAQEPDAVQPVRP